jgi:2-desacetyl-2-hydroxyethyl bacteriochlorophyllide A dehydrogenase
MRAIVTRLQDDNVREKVLVSDWPEPPAPTGNQVKTRTLYSGITNGTERNDLVRGNYANPDEALPAGWGYQNVGEVVGTGPDVKDLAVGDVIYSSNDHTEFCIAEENGLVVKIPTEVDRVHAALFGMASVAMRSVRNADLRMGQSFLVVGAGFIGQTAAQIANIHGARVTICDVNEHRLEAARSVGAAEKVVNVSGEGWKDHIRYGYDAVLDVAGVVGMEDKLLGAVRPRGTVLFIAGRVKVEYNFGLGQGQEIVIKQNSHFDRSDLENVCRLVGRGMLQVGAFVQDIVPPADAKRIYDILRDRPAELYGTVFDWQK